MAQSEGELLRALEHLMAEFFDYNTTNARKHDIETQLNSFSSQTDAWRPCMYFLTNTSSQFVSMYALSTIETVINRQWVGLEWEHRVQLKAALYNFYLEQDSAAPNFIRNKLAKVLVDIARYDWPHFYPEFFSNVIQLLQSESSQLLGLILLRTTSEELMSPRPDLSSFRRAELTKLLQQQIPQVFQILNGILDHVGNRPRLSSTATPPPSPTNNPTSTAPDLVRHISTSKAFRSSDNNKAVVREVLAALQHLFTWASLAQVPSPIVSAIFNYTNISSYAQDDDDVCVLAMSTLNELLYRKCAPAGSQPLFIQLYHHTVQLLRDISCPNNGKLETIGQDFTEKLSELLSLLIEQYLWRLECEPGFSALDFLALLYQLTMQLPTTQCYLHCLTVWTAFIKQIKPTNAIKYSEALLGLVNAVLNKLQFTCNFAQLEDTNHVDVDDNNETEWQILLNTSVEIIAMIAEFAPLDTLNSVLIPWRTANDMYALVDQAVYVGRLSLSGAEAHRLHSVLRDLSSLTQTVARLADVFTNQVNSSCGDNETDNRLQQQRELAAPAIAAFVDRLTESALRSTADRYYHLQMIDDRLAPDFTEVHTHLLTALKTFTLHGYITSAASNAQQHSDYTNSNNRQPQHDQQHLHTILMDIVLPILRSGALYPQPVVTAAGHLLRTLSGTVVAPSRLLQVDTVVEFVQHMASIRYERVDIKGLIASAVCSILIRNDSAASNLDTVRQPLLNTFFDGITSEFRQLTRDVSEAKAADIVARTLPPLCDIVEYCSAYPTASKRVLHCGLKSTIEHAIEIFPAFSRYPAVSDVMLTFFLAVLNVLQQQIGIATTSVAVQAFLEIAISDNQTKNLSGLDKLLQIMQIVVEAPGNSYKTFLPGILQLCLQNVYPLAISKATDHPDVIIALISLLHSVLLHRWNYFYTSQVRMGHSPGCSDQDLGQDSVRQPEQLVTMLQVFGQSLMQSDINTFRSSLGALESLHTKWKLYNKGLIKEQLLGEFLTVLLQCILNKSHNILLDDICQAIYNMASVDFSSFFTTFLSNFIQRTDGLAPPQRDSLRQGFTQETDMPTFLQNLQRFTNDMSCFKLCNSSLPPGSVVL